MKKRDERKMLTVRVPPELYAAVKKLAWKRQTTMNEFVVRLLSGAAAMDSDVSAALHRDQAARERQ